MHEMLNKIYLKNCFATVDYFQLRQGKLDFIIQLK